MRLIVNKTSKLASASRKSRVSELAAVLPAYKYFGDLFSPGKNFQMMIEISQGLKPRLFGWLCGTAEAVPCYKACHSSNSQSQ
jgi:hypothetical protein